MLGVFAEFERAIMQERIHAGIARARVVGTKSGRRIGRPKVSAQKEQAIRAEVARGKGLVNIARQLGVGVSTVQRVKAAMDVLEPQSGAQAPLKELI